jgi:hypothetical protein
VEGQIALKSGAGRRKVPIPAVLRDYLAEHLARNGRAGSDRFSGCTGEAPFDGQKSKRERTRGGARRGLTGSRRTNAGTRSPR